MPKNAKTDSPKTAADTGSAASDLPISDRAGPDLPPKQQSPADPERADSDPRLGKDSAPLTLSEPGAQPFGDDKEIKPTGEAAPMATPKDPFAKDELAFTPASGKTEGEAPKAAEPVNPQPSTDPLADLTPPAAPPRRSALPMLLAGVVTAGLGLGAGWALWAPGGFLAGTSPLEARLATLEQQLSGLGTALKSAEEKAATAEAGLVPLQDRLASAEASVAPLAEALQSLEAKGQQNAAALAALEAKLTDLIQRPPESDPTAVAAYERELAALREAFSAQLDQIRAGSEQTLAEIEARLGSELGRIEAQAQAAAEASEESASLQAAAERTAAVAGLNAALDSGLPLTDPLARLAAAAPDLDLASFDPFAEGVPTLLSLQESFPDAARAALAAETRSGNGEAGFGGALKGFLGMRSLAPKDGNSTDAILSRAEAALAAGDLAKALAETDALSPVPLAELKEWRGAAQARLAALTAFTMLSDAVEK